MNDIHARVAVLEEKVENHERILIEKRRKEDKLEDILEDIRSKQTRSNGFMAGVAAAVSMIWAVIILAYDEIKAHLGH